MNRYQQLIERIVAGEKILIDGATGTEIELRGVPQLENAWNGGGALSHPGVLRQVHADYIREGAEVVISNTFATSRHALRDAGQDDKFEIYNRRGIELACQARKQIGAQSVLVAGGISYRSMAKCVCATAISWSTQSRN
jgi:S-methylmethionine-dependent homocysteine/selenocysteine methylase